jgi:hypothetical protein
MDVNYKETSLMLFDELTAVYSENDTGHACASCSHFNMKRSGAYSNRCSETLRHWPCCHFELREWEETSELRFLQWSLWRKCLLWCNIAYTGSSPTFRGSILPPYSESKNKQNKTEVWLLSWPTVRPWRRVVSDGHAVFLDSRIWNIFW